VFVGWYRTEVRFYISTCSLTSISSRDRKKAAIMASTRMPTVSRPQLHSAPMASQPDVRLATLLDLPQLTPTKSALDAKYDTYQK